MARARRTWAGAVGALVLGTTVGFATGGAAQVGVDNSISLQAYNCPPGMAADALVADECVPTTEGFDVRIDSLTGIMAPLTLAEATLDGATYVWGDEVIDARGAYGPLAIQETVLPTDYTEYLVAGDGVERNEFGDWTFAVTPESPNPALSIYNFAPAGSAPDGDPSQPAPPPDPGEPDPGPQEPALPAVIRAGTCDDLAAEAVSPLAPLTWAAGGREGATAAVPVATSYTEIDAPLAELLASDHAIVVAPSDQSPDASDGAVVACGEIGGAALPEGALALGLRERNGSGVVGVAYLAPLPDNPGQTGVTLFVARDLA